MTKCDDKELVEYLDRIKTGDFPLLERVIKSYFNLSPEAQHSTDQVFESMFNEFDH